MIAPGHIRNTAMGGVRLAARHVSTYNIQQVPQTWAKLKNDEKDEIIEHLAIEQERPWRELSWDTKRACFYISYGGWGPRAEAKPISYGYWVFAAAVLGGAGVVTMSALKSDNQRASAAKESA